MLKRGFQLLKQLWASDPKMVLLLLALGAGTSAFFAAEARFQVPGLSLIAILMFVSCSFLMRIVDTCADEARRTGLHDPLTLSRELIVVAGLLFMLVTSTAAVATYVALSLWEDRLWLTIGLAAASVGLFGTLSWLAANSKWKNPNKR